MIAHFVGNINKTTLLLLPAFSSIQLITLAKPSIEHLDLEPLQFLPKLIQLNLIHGSFLGREYLNHLMQLKMVLSRADCDSNCRFAACLEHLFLVKSKLAKFHYHGLSACDNLERLSCLSSAILSFTDNHRRDIYFHDAHPLQEPSGLSSLTGLCSLLIDVIKTAGQLHLEWLTELPALTYLNATLEV